MDTISFALTAEYEGTVDLHGDGNEVPCYLGGVLSIAGDRPFDVREALDEGDGIITVSTADPSLLTALDDYPALKRVPTPEGATILDDLDAAGMGDLRGEARRIGLVGYGRLNKTELRDVIREHRRRVSEASPDEPVPTEVDDLTTEAGGAGEEN